MRASTLLSISAVPVAVLLALAQSPQPLEREKTRAELADMMFKQYPAWAKRMQIAEMAKTSTAKAYAWICNDRSGGVECLAMPLSP
jgi:hypothetical protein